MSTRNPAPATASGAQVEKEFVADFYDAVALKWHGTRYKAWPRVVDWIRVNADSKSLVYDLGCGNGKNLQHCAGFAIGSDVSVGLIKYASPAAPENLSENEFDRNEKLPDGHAYLVPKNSRNWDVLCCDGMKLPHKSASFDCLICIAVLHHVSTVERRIKLLSEAARIVKSGGKLLFYVWAWEQKSTGTVTKHRFETQDVMMPFTDNISGKTSLRYCHVYAKNELEDLVSNVETLQAVDTWTDTGNYAVVCVKRADKSPPR